MNSAAPVEKWYRRIGRVSVGAVLFLILVGGIVRSTGSGMGCPDWPKCFGLFVPPTDIAEIPPTFFDLHPEYESQTFNVFQTWVEYVNRLVGALIGLFMLITAALSLSFRRKDKRITILSIGALLLTGFEGWLGKLVVDHNLSGGMVTIHMLVALIILAMVITAVYLAEVYRHGRPMARHAVASSSTLWLGLAVLLLTLAQILIGTQVREMVDEIAVAMGGENRETWVDQLGGIYAIHKVLWIVVTGAIVVWVRNLIREAKDNRQIRFFAWLVLGTLGLEILFGILLGNFALPPILQPLHLLFASLIFGAEYALLVNIAGVERILQKQMKVDYNTNRKFANAKQ